MKNSNIIISVIIVLCIAGGVSAYSFLNPEGSIFSLSGYTPSDGDDTGDLGGDGNAINGTETNGGEITGGGSGSGGSSPGGGSGNGNSGGSGGGSNVHIGMTSSQARTIINGAVSEPGAYAGTPRWDGSINMWISKIYDKDGNVVDSIGVDANKRTNKV